MYAMTGRVNSADSCNLSDMVARATVDAAQALANQEEVPEEMMDLVLDVRLVSPTGQVLHGQAMTVRQALEQKEEVA